MPSSDASSPASEDENMPAAVDDSGEGSDSEPENSEPDQEDDRYGVEEEEEEEEEVVEEEEEVVEEEEEEEEEEIEEEEAEEDQQEGEEGEDEEGQSADLSDSPAAVDDDLNDSSHEIESEGQYEDLRPEKTEEGLASYANHRENNVCEYDPNSLNDPLAKQANGLSGSVAENKGVGVKIEEEAPIMTRINAQKYYHGDQNGNKPHLGSCNHMGADSTEALFDEKEVAAKDLIKDGSDCKVSSSIPISQKETRLMDMESGDGIKFRASSSIMPKLRPRSLSPGAEVEERNKKPVIVCTFFAKGWCIKGTSCRFLHQKDDVGNTSKRAKENVVVGSSEEYSQEDAGPKQEAVKTIIPPSSETVDPSIANDPFDRSHTPSERIPLGGHGESKRWHMPYAEHKPPSLGREDISSGIAQSESSHSFEQFPLPNELPWKSSVGEEYRSFGVPLLNRNQNHRSDFMDSKRFASEALIGGYSLGGSNSISSYRFSSSGSAISSSIYGNSNNSLGYGKSVMESPSLKLESQSVIHNSHSSPEFSCSLNSSFNTSLPPIGISPSHRAFTWLGSSPSRSSSLSRNSSSPFYSRSAQESLPLHVIPRDPSVSIGNMIPSTVNNWEPSIPFKPSFNFSSIITSSGSQYDPLLDSIEPPNEGVRPFQPSFSQGSSFQNVLHKQTAGDSLTCSQHPQSAVSNHSIYSHGAGAYTTAAEAADTSTVGQQNRSPMSKEEKPSNPEHVNASNAKKVDLENNPRHQTAGSKHSKEAKMLKLFRASLVDLVKELVKPSWREGHLSKDAHNIVVKKAVDKVLNALQPHQIPSTTESISQYLSSSRPKLAKLVEGYVGKYGKS